MINQPETSGTTPEKFDKALENIRNEIIIGEQKVKQLENAQRQVAGEIRAGLQTKTELISLLETLSAERDARCNEVTTLEKRGADLKSTIEESEKALVKISEEINSRSEMLSQREHEYLADKNNFESDKSDHALAVSNLKEEKRVHDEKVKRLQEALS